MKKQLRKSEYDNDFYLWTVHQAEMLRKHDFDKMDLENLIEEIESLGKSDKQSIKSALVVLLTHLLKQEYQPDGQGNSKSWDASIRNSKNIIFDLIEESPSLKKYPKEIFEKCYERARKNAQAETGIHESIFPRKCPWDISEILE